MTKNPIFTGAATALVTPLTEKGVDYETVKKNAKASMETISIIRK